MLGSPLLILSDNLLQLLAVAYCISQKRRNEGLKYFFYQNTMLPTMVLN